MKLINRLNEALGVPEGILEVAEGIYDKIVKTDFKYNIVEDLFDGDGDSNEINTQFKIGDLTFKKTSFLINVMVDPKVDKVEFAFMSIPSDYELLSIGRLKNEKYDNLHLFFHFYCPSNPTINDKRIKSEIKKLLGVNKNIFISRIAHELKHGYDTNKTPYENILRQSKYNTYHEFASFPVRIISDLFYFSYFVSVSETLVKPTEVMSLIRSHQITKKDFLNFIKNNETYKTLDEIRNMTVEDFSHELYENKDDIYFYVLKYAKKDMSSESYWDIISVFLNIVKDSIEEHTMEFVEDIINEDRFADSIDYIEDKKKIKAYLKYASREVKKYKNIDDFFKSKIENNAKKANLVMRKLSKLYAMAK
jgi:hypothetical protein